jgi:hypothetical protein
MKISWRNSLPLIYHGILSIITHFSFHKRPFTLLPKPPYVKSKPRIVFLWGILTGSKTLSLSSMLLKKATWPTSPPQSKLTFPLNLASYKKSPLASHATLNKSLLINISLRNTGIVFPSHIQRCLASILLYLNIESTPSWI